MYEIVRRFRGRFVDVKGVIVENIPPWGIEKIFLSFIPAEAGFVDAGV
jgi:hypothetical protein